MFVCFREYMHMGYLNPFFDCTSRPDNIITSIHNFPKRRTFFVFGFVIFVWHYISHCYNLFQGSRLLVSTH